MLYLVKPDGRMDYTKMPASVLGAAASTPEADLGRLDWEPSEQHADDVILALALRYGAKASCGIVLDSQHVAMQQRPALLIQTHDAAARSQAALRIRRSQADLDRDARIDETSQREVERARADIQRALAARDLDPALVEHWTRLGGAVPVS